MKLVVGYAFTPRFALIAGPSLNLLVTPSPWAPDTAFLSAVWRGTEGRKALGFGSDER